MSSFQKKFHQSLKEWLERNGVAVDTVIGYDDDADVYADSLSDHVVIEVYIKYMYDGDLGVFTYGGPFSEILKELV